MIFKKKLSKKSQKRQENCLILVKGCSWKKVNCRQLKNVKKAN